MPDRHDDDLRAALSALGARFDEVAPPILLDEVRSSRLGSEARRPARWLLGSAALIIAVFALFAWSDARPNDQLSLGSEPVAGNPSEFTPGAPGEADATTPLPDGSADEVPNSVPHVEDLAVSGESAVVELVEQLDAYDAAALLYVDALAGPSPAEEADIIIANELTSRGCFEREELALPPFDPARHEQARRFAESAWEARLRSWTQRGRERLRREGFLPPAAESEFIPYPHLTASAPAACLPAATGVTHLGDTSVWSEFQLGERLLTEPDLQRWKPGALSFGRLPGSEDDSDRLDQCIVARGWTEWGERGIGLTEVMFGEGDASEGLSLARDLADCIESIGFLPEYLSALADAVDDFAAEHQATLRQIEAERADALRSARSVLQAAGITPFTSE